MPSTLNSACPQCGLGFGNEPLLDLHIRDDHRQRVARPRDDHRDPGSSRAAARGADTPRDPHHAASTPSPTSREATAARTRHGRRARRAMTALRRALRFPRYVNGEPRRAPDFFDTERAVVCAYRQAIWKPRRGASPAPATEPAIRPPEAQWLASSSGLRQMGSPIVLYRLRTEARKEAIHSQGIESRREIDEPRDDMGRVPRRIRADPGDEPMPSVRVEVVAINQNRMPEASDDDPDWLAFKEWAEDKPLIRVADRAPREKTHGFLSRWFYLMLASESEGRCVRFTGTCPTIFDKSELGNCTCLRVGPLIDCCQLESRLSRDRSTLVGFFDVPIEREPSWLTE